MKIEQLMTRNVVTVAPETPLKVVAELLVRHRISGLPVCRADGAVVGIVSEADILWKEVGFADERPGVLGRILDTAYGDSERIGAVTAGQAMSSPPITISPTSPVSAAAELMVERGINRLPVVDEGRLVGIVARADLVRAFTRTDLQIEREIREDVLLHTLWVDPADVAITVSNGTVALSGELDNRTTAELVEAYVRRVPGVVSIHSNLRWQVDDHSRRRLASTSYSDGLTIY